jgi:hypothetical protein
MNSHQRGERQRVAFDHLCRLLGLNGPGRDGVRQKMTLNGHRRPDLPCCTTHLSIHDRPWLYVSGFAISLNSFSSSSKSLDFFFRAIAFANSSSLARIALN